MSALSNQDLLFRKLSLLESVERDLELAKQSQTRSPMEKTEIVEEVMELRAETEHLQRVAANYKAERDSLTRLLDTMEETRESERVEELQDQNRNLEDRLASHEASVKQYEATIQDLEDALLAADKSANESDEEIKALKAKITELKFQNDHLRVDDQDKRLSQAGNDQHSEKITA